jgi:hypothetical protein
MAKAKHEIKHNFFLNTVPNSISKYYVFVQFSIFHVRRDIGKARRVEGHKSLHTAYGPTRHICSVTITSDDNSPGTSYYPKSFIFVNSEKIYRRGKLM